MLAAMSSRDVRICNRGFVSLLTTMSCGAFNDNLLRGALLLAVVTGGAGLWEGQLGPGSGGWVLAMLYAPFIVLLGITGQIADRWPRKRVIVVSRVLEVLLSTVVIWAFSVGSLMVACLSLVLMASQSALFSPAKYGIVPDLVDGDSLSRANGMLSMLTNFMIIVGVAASAFLVNEGALLGWVMLALACVGLGSSFFIPSGRAANPDLELTMRTFTTHIHTLRAIQTTPLMVATIAWCWFYAIGSMIIAIVPNYKGPLGLTDISTSLLLAAPGVGIAIGGVAAGFGSGDRIRGRLVPLGGAFMTIGLLLLGLLNPSLVWLAVLLGCTGIAAGFFVVPILSLLQHLPVPGFRARCVSTANFCTYLAMATTAIIYALLAPIVGNDPEIWFLVCAVLMAGVTVWTFRRRETLRVAGLHGSAMTVKEHA
jgi:acyl-[acyl-carrier-protein]-phospholipid O-acyltransferase/long-chain-fatty-acid--[acyl-carrier-protein] ligase